MVATKDMNLQVIYGDTDSLMVNTGKDNLQDALDIAKKVKEEINKKYTKLEIEVGGVFKSLLLLKKKKYAALKLKNPYDEKAGIFIDIKGLDMVRRDWCNLAKVLSDETLKELLSGRNSKEIALSLNGKFADYGNKLQNKQIKLSQFIINKQLTKPLADYKDAQRQPHVKVAQMLIKKGTESEANLVGHFIPYVICKGNTNLQFADRAFHPSEVHEKNLEVDTVWYASQQIIPPLQRLLEYLKEFNLDSLPIHFGLNPRFHKIIRAE
jgi:DNA polymerase alpha subunit A